GSYRRLSSIRSNRRSKPTLVRQKGSRFIILIATSSIEQHGYKGRRTPRPAPVHVEPSLVALDDRRFRIRSVDVKGDAASPKLFFALQKIFLLKLCSAFLIFSSRK